MSTTRPAVVFLSLVLVLLAAQPALAQSLTAAPQPVDVRVLIDVSGSMKQNDPHNLRRPAVDLLVKLLPEASQAGIWLFGNDAQVLVPHEPVSSAWRGLAEQGAGQINSNAKFTDIGAALEAALAAGAVAKGNTGSIILLTDGVVDIAQNDEINQQEWQRIINELLPELQHAGLTVHTIALSENTDQDLLNKLSLATNGLSATAETADELMSAFLKIFDAAAPAERVSLDGNHFTVDASIEEFTALVFRQAGSEPAKLQDPKGKTLSYADRGYNIGWHRGDNYDLITVSEPVDGQWQILAEMAPDSRVTVVSNLRLRVRKLPTNVYKGQSLPVSFALRENDSILNRPEFLRLMTFHAELQYLGGDESQTVWQTSLGNEEPPASGIFTVQLPNFAASGDYQLTLRVDGKSFQREISHSFTAHMPFAADITAEQDGSTRYRLTLRSNSTAVDPSRTQVVATLINPEGRRKVRPMALTEYQNWQLTITPADSGHHLVEVTVSGTERGGYDFQYRLDDLEFYYSPERGMIRRDLAGENVLVEPEPVVADVGTEAPKEPDAEPAEVQPSIDTAEPVAADDSAPEDEAHPRAEVETPVAPAEWGLYGSLGLGNLLLLALGYWGYRRIRGNEHDADAILDEFSEERIGSDIDTPVAPEQAADQGEPEMAGMVGAGDDAHKTRDAALSDEKDAAPAHEPESPVASPSLDAADIEDILADAGQGSDVDAVDEVSLDEALASILGELEDPAPVKVQDESADEDTFGLSEEDEGAAEDDSNR